MVAHRVRVAGVAGSNPVIPILFCKIGFQVEPTVCPWGILSSTAYLSPTAQAKSYLSDFLFFKIFFTFIPKPSIILYVNSSIKKYSVILVSVCTAGIISAYGLLLFAMPSVVNSKTFISFVQSEIAKKTEVLPSIVGMKYSIKPNLSSELNIKSLTICNKSSNKIITAQNLHLKLKPLTFMPEQAIIDTLFVDSTEFSKIKIKKNKTSKKTFDLNNIPEITVNNAHIILNNNNELTLNNTSLIKNNDRYLINFSSELKSKNLKHKITTDNTGTLIYKNNTIFAENLTLNIENSPLTVNGKLLDTKKQYDFNLIGTNIPVRDIEEGFLFYIKLKKPDKNFIENFYDFSGLANINLNFKNGSINGNALINNLSAKTVLYSIPILLPKAEFKFLNTDIQAAAKGKFGNEDVYTDFFVKDLFSPEKLVYGSVKSKLGKKFTELYTPDIKITGTIDALVKYQVFKGNILVEYLAGINNGSNIYYRHADLGLTDRSRRLYAKTLKQGNKLYLKNYDYSYTNGGKTENILLGNGLFVKKDGKYTLDNINCRTNGEAPVSVTGSFGRYIDGGTFSGDLSFHYPQNLLTGNIALHNSRYKSFFVKNASVAADEKLMKITADGSFENSEFNCYANLDNSFDDKVTINDLNLNLKEYVIKRQHNSTNIKLKIPENSKNIKWTIKNGTLTLVKLRYNKILLENLELTGNLKDDLINFSMPDIDFASGKLSAYGRYDIEKHNSDINFSAQNINSNLAADMIFDLKNQIEGYANATMKLKTLNKLEKIHAHTDFSIKDGALTKLGSTEFFINKSNKRKFKFTIPDITNIDINRMKALKSNIDGCFDINNHNIENIKLFSKHKYLSIFAEGNYDIREQNADLRIWGAYNRNAQKGIRILFVPLSLITKVILRPEYTKSLYRSKLNMIPPIEASPSEHEDFTVRINGNLNDNSTIKVQFKSIR